MELTRAQIPPDVVGGLEDSDIAVVRNAMGSCGGAGMSYTEDGDLVTGEERVGGWKGW